MSVETFNDPLTLENTAVFLDGKQLDLSVFILEQIQTPIQILPKDGFTRYELGPRINVLHLKST